MLLHFCKDGDQWNFDMLKEAGAAMRLNLFQRGALNAACNRHLRSDRLSFYPKGPQPCDLFLSFSNQLIDGDFDFSELF